MKRAVGITPVFALQAIIAVAAGGVLFGVLAWVSEPARARPRIAAIEQSTTAAKALEKAVRPAPRSQPSSLCTDNIAHVARTYPALLAQVAGRSGVAVADPRADAEIAGGGPLSSVSVTFEVHGSQDAAMGFLSQLGAQQPVLFVRKLEISPKAGAVDLHVEGVIWCAA